VERLLESCENEWTQKSAIIERERKKQMDLDKRYTELVDEKNKSELNLNQREIKKHFDHLQQLETLASIQKMIQVILFIVPDFFQLSQNILSSRYQKQKTLQRKQLKEQATKESSIRELLSKLFGNLAEKINNAIANLDDERAHQTVLCACVGEVLRCWEKLSALPNIPTVFLSALGDYAQGLRKFIIEETWSRSIREIAKFYVHEDWTNINEKLSITQLPIRFKDHVLQTVNLLKPFIRPDDVRLTFNILIIANEKSHYGPLVGIFISIRR
jgi:hypothetical protein